ncbi:MAG: hypothetical protein ACLSG7_06040 [Clostridia bacterium]|nr:probable molybdenum cofactor biosynthesis protein A [Clostridium sp. CAG:389]
MKVKTLEIPRNQYRMSIISSCNMKCVYCHNEGNNEISMLKLEDIEKIIKDSKEYGLKAIRLTRRRTSYTSANLRDM